MSLKKKNNNTSQQDETLNFNQVLLDNPTVTYNPTKSSGRHITTIERKNKKKLSGKVK